MGSDVVPLDSCGVAMVEEVDVMSESECLGEMSMCRDGRPYTYIAIGNLFEKGCERMILL